MNLETKDGITIILASKRILTNLNSSGYILTLCVAIGTGSA